MSLVVQRGVPLRVVYQSFPYYTSVYIKTISMTKDKIKLNCVNINYILFSKVILEKLNKIS